MQQKALKYIYFLPFIFLLSGCFKEDELIPAHKPGNVITGQVGLTDNYKYQVYFDLSTDSIVYAEIKTVWDLGFDCADSAIQIILNSAKFMKLAKTGKTNIIDFVDTTGIAWLYDPSSGNPDSNAVGKWVDISTDPDVYTNEVYVVDRGTDEEGNSLGARKIQFYKWDNEHYYLRYCNLDGSKLDSCIITKNHAKNFTGFSFNKNGYQIEIEPDKNSWDLFFTQYTTILYTDVGHVPTPYLVLGVLLNPNSTMAAILSDVDFNKVDFDYIKSLQLSSRRDAIGYEWKVYKFTDGIYVVNTQNTYIIKDTDGYLYKLRFISFYNDLGDKGYPKFEFVKL